MLTFIKQVLMHHSYSLVSFKDLLLIPERPVEVEELYEASEPDDSD
jgi:hypothetical protein